MEIFTPQFHEDKNILYAYFYRKKNYLLESNKTMTPKWYLVLLHIMLHISDTEFDLNFWWYVKK